MSSALLSMSHLHRLQDLHGSLPQFSPLIPVALLPYLAFTLLAATFTLAFYFSTLPQAKLPAHLGVAGLASLLGGFGVVTLFCSVGVNV